MNKLYIAIPLAAAVGFLILPFVIYSGSQIMTVTSDSMLPTLQPNDLIIVESATVDQIKENDIIAFESHMQFGIVAHRAVDFHQENEEILIVTKGDNIDDPDGWTVSNEDLIGKVIEIIPKMGILLVDPVRYSLIAVIVITSIFMLKESFESKTSSKPEE